MQNSKCLPLHVFIVQHSCDVLPNVEELCSACHADLMKPAMAYTEDKLQAATMWHYYSTTLLVSATDNWSHSTDR